MQALKGFIILIPLFCVTAKATAQLTPLWAQYYQNEYLGNPSLAGSDKGLRLNLGYRSQWNTFPGAPENQSLAVDFNLNEKVGLGVNMFQDKAGLLSRDKMMATFAYHLPLNEETTKVHFGLSFGLLSEHLSLDKFVGSMNDVNVLTFNNRKNSFDADFGLAYTDKNLSIQGTLYNLKSTIKGDQTNTVDYAVYYTAIAYKLNYGKYSVTPKIAYRKVRNFTSLFDAGAELNSFQEQLKLTAIYHSNKSSTFGFRFLYNSTVELLGMYTTSGKPLQIYSEGTFEVGLKVIFAGGD